MLAASGCSVAGPDSDSKQAEQKAIENSSAAVSQAESQSESQNGESKSDDSSKSDKIKNEDNKATVTLNGSSASIDQANSSVTIDGTTVKLTASGVYTFKGKLDDGVILVDAPKTDKVEIYLDGVEIQNGKTAPLRIEACGGCTVHLTEGSTNTFSDSTSNEFSACISSKDDLTIKGKGTLIVTGAAKHAIKSSNDLRIKNGVYELNSASAALYGEDSVEITGGKITVTACKDGIKSKNDSDSTKGIVTIEEAEIDIQGASGNGIEAAASVTVKSGSVKIHSLKTPVNCNTQNIADGTVQKY